MGTNKSVVISFSIAILLLLSLLLLLTYNSKSNPVSGMAKKSQDIPVGLHKNIPEPFYYEKFANTGVSVADIDNKQRDISMASSGIGNFKAADTSGSDMYNQALVTSGETNNDQGQFASFETREGDKISEEDGMRGMQSCYPRDRLTADDLLPKDAADSKWAQINPSGTGNVGDQNYLSAGYHVGVNTVGQSLRNANLQLRSEIPNPQNAVGPWLISTIEPDIRQNTLEIGSSASY
jgi:hypothetical protein